MSRQPIPLIARVLPILTILFLFAGARPAKATIIEWQVGDHPGGALADPTYALRLGTDATHPNTFTVETSGAGATFQFDPMGVAINTDQAKLVGTIQHNRDSTGPISGGFYSIDATFTTAKFTDPDAAKWYDPNPNNMVYDDMLMDLLTMSDDTPLNDTSFLLDADRIYFQLMDMTLIHTGGTNTYTGPLSWDEYPNSPDSDKQFFIQLNHRTSSNVLAAAGWLEVSPDAGPEGRRTSDVGRPVYPPPRTGTYVPVVVKCGVDSNGPMGPPPSTHPG